MGLFYRGIHGSLGPVITGFWAEMVLVCVIVVKRLGRPGPEEKQV